VSLLLGKDKEIKDERLKIKAVAGGRASVSDDQGLQTIRGVKACLTGGKLYRVTVVNSHAENFEQ
jgi:hypothetical protein